MPFGEGYTVEAQITGQETIGGLQFEVTPAIIPKVKHVPCDQGSLMIFIRTLTGKTATIRADPTDTIDTVKEMIETEEGIPCDQQRLVAFGKQLEDGKILGTISTLF